jgi:hypothetical protein
VTSHGTTAVVRAQTRTEEQFDGKINHATSWYTCILVKKRRTWQVVALLQATPVRSQKCLQSEKVRTCPADLP